MVSDIAPLTLFALTATEIVGITFVGQAKFGQRRSRDPPESEGSAEPSGEKENFVLEKRQSNQARIYTSEVSARWLRFRLYKLTSSLCLDSSRRKVNPCLSFVSNPARSNRGE